MADVVFEITDICGKSFFVKNVLSYEFRKDKGVPCDSLRLYYYDDKPMNEFVSIKAYKDKNIVFNGFVDLSQQTENIKGNVCYIYARNSACALVDNEATPFTYYSPSTSALFMSDCNGFGLENKLPELCIDSSYQVAKGVSCFEMLDDFCQIICGKGIMVTPKNEVMLQKSENKLSLDDMKIISKTKSINRGNALANIDYKVRSDTDYVHHRKCNALINKGINRSAKKNLSNIPDWQWDNYLNKIFDKANEKYYVVKLEIEGFFDAKILDEMVIDDESFYISNVCIVMNKNEQKTVLTLCKPFDYEEVTYVD